MVIVICHFVQLHILDLESLHLLQGQTSREGLDELERASRIAEDRLGEGSPTPVKAMPRLMECRVLTPFFPRQHRVDFIDQHLQRSNWESHHA